MYLSSELSFCRMSRISCTMDGFSLLYLLKILLMRSGDVETNPGPDRIVSEKELLKLSKQIEPSYYKEVGINLDISIAELGQIEKDSQSTSDALMTVFMRWKDKQPPGTDIRTLLAEGLEGSDLGSLSGELLTGSLVPTRTGAPDTMPGSQTRPLSTEQIMRCAEDFKVKYRTTLCKIRADPLVPHSIVPFSDMYTNLVLEEEYRKHKRPLEYRDLFDLKVNREFPKRIMVEGEAGIGKTTFCAKIAWDWITENPVLPKFVWVLVVPFREAKQYTIGEIAKSYLSKDNPATACQITEYIRSNPKDIFIAFDGLDESHGQVVQQTKAGSESECHQTKSADQTKARSGSKMNKNEYPSLIMKPKSSIPSSATSQPRVNSAEASRSSSERGGIALGDILSSDELATCPVLVTSRQWKVAEIRLDDRLNKQYTFMHLEGFSKENVKVYFHKYFQDDGAKADQLLQLTKDNVIISDTMALYPIYTAMLCLMWKELKDAKQESFVDVSFGSQDLETAALVRGGTSSLAINHITTAHTIAGYVFTGLYKDVVLPSRCPTSASSQHLAEALCSMPNLADLILQGNDFQEEFYSTLNVKVSTLQVEMFKLEDVRCPTSASSHHLADALCSMPNLTGLALHANEFQEEFYSTLNAKVSTLQLAYGSRRPPKLRDTCAGRRGSGDVETNPGQNRIVSVLSEKELLMLSKKIEPSFYKDVGINLDISRAELGKIKERSKNTSDALMTVFKRWRDKQPPGTDMRALLAEKLERSDLGSLSCELLAGSLVLKGAGISVQSKSNEESSSPTHRSDKTTSYPSSPNTRTSTTTPTTAAAATTISQKAFFIITLLAWVAVTVSGTTPEISSMTGDTVNIPCLFGEGTVRNIFWSYNDGNGRHKILFLADGNLHKEAEYANRASLQDDFSTLILKDITVADEGTYYCVVDRQGQTAVTNINTQLNVFSLRPDTLPVISPCTGADESSSCSIHANQSFTLTCTLPDVHPVEDTKVIWYQDGQHVSSTDNGTQNDDGTTDISQQIQVSETGIFTCNATYLSANGRENTAVSVEAWIIHVPPTDVPNTPGKNVMSGPIVALTIIGLLLLVTATICFLLGARGRYSRRAGYESNENPLNQVNY